MTTAREGCRASCAWRRDGAKAAPTLRPLIRRFAPPSPAGGRRICGEQAAGWRGGRCGGVKLHRPARPHPALCATFSRGREKDLRGASGGVVRRLLWRCEAAPTRRALIRRFAPPSPAGGRRICGEQAAGWRGGRCGGVKLHRPARPHPALCATFSRRREKDLPRLSGVGTTQAARPVMQRGCHCLLPLAGEGARRADGGDAYARHAHQLCRNT
ncbi:hypothetical protein FHT15_003971 [Xanthomonas campestris]